MPFCFILTLVRVRGFFVPFSLSCLGSVGEPKMEDDMDDFGDIYGDLEDRVTAGIPCVQEHQYSLPAERTMRSSKCGGFDSIGEERSSDDRIGEGNARPVASNRGKESLVFGVQESGNSSDSEDDLRIVLNEDDCLKMPPSQRGDLGSGGLVVGERKGDEEDEDLVNLHGSDCPQQNLKWGDQLSSPADGMVQVSTARGNAAKLSCPGWEKGSRKECCYQVGKRIRRKKRMNQPGVQVATRKLSKTKSRLVSMLILNLLRVETNSTVLENLLFNCLFPSKVLPKLNVEFVVVSNVLKPRWIDLLNLSNS